MVLALALIHHLTIGKNIPFEKIAEMFSKITKYLIIEFVPKEDEKVKLILKNKKDIYTDYSKEHFVSAFSTHFHIVHEAIVKDSERTLLFMKRKN